MASFPRPDDAVLTELAVRFGTPLWVYDAMVLDARIRAWRDALAGFDHQLCYAVKANGNLALLQRMARAGLGFDVVSVGELARVERAGGDPAATVFSGVGKRVDEIDAALAAGVHSINCESADELETIAARASALRVAAPVCLRVNPGVDALTHPHIATGDQDDKFGTPLAAAAELARHAATLPGIRLLGLAMHIGSQLVDLSPLELALQRTLALHDALVDCGLKLTELDVGGGLGVRYRDEAVPTPADHATLVRRALGDRALKVVVEPGRSLVAEAGVLLTRVITVKRSDTHVFVVADAGMSELLRPALYGAWHPIDAVAPHGEPFACEVVGPLCESGDVLGSERRLATAKGGLLVIGCAGAYGAAMSSQYNARPAAAEVLLADDKANLIRSRGTVEDLWRGEHLL